MTPTRWVRNVLVTVAVLATAAATSCGIPVERQPDVIPPDDVPFDLLAPPTTTTTTAPPRVPVDIAVYFVTAERLVAVARQVSSPGTVDRRLEALSAGPTAEEQAAGIRTAIAAVESLGTATVSGQTAVIALAPAFSSVQGPEQVVAVAQVVFTATETAGVAAVSFTIDDRLVEVPAGDGTLKATLTRADFPTLAPPPPPGPPPPAPPPGA